MAEEEKILILSVELDLNQFQKEADEAGKELDELLIKQEKMRAESKQGTTEFAANAAQIRNVRQQLNENAKALNNVQQLQKKNTGSIKEMRQELSVATTQWNNLSKAERDNINIGGKLQKQIKGLSDELKKNESAIGDNRRNVGNYKQAIQGAISSLNLFGGSLGNLSGLLGAAGPLGLALVGTIGLFKGLETAISFTESGAEFLQRRTAGMGAAFDIFKGKLSGLATFLSTSPILGALFNLPSAVSQGVGGSAVTTAESLTGAVQALDDAQRDLNVSVSANNVLIDQYLARSKNRTLTDEERIDLLNKASKLEEENLTKELAIQERRLAVQNLDIERLRQAGVLRDEDLQKQADIQVKINSLKQASLSLQEKIKTREDAIIDAKLKREEAAAQKALEAEKKKLDEIGKLQVQSQKDRENFIKAKAEEERIITDELNAQAELDLKNQFANREITEVEFTERLVQIKAEAMQRELDDLMAQSGRTIGLEDEVAQKKIEIATFLADAKIQQNEKVTESNKKELEKQIKQEQERQELVGGFIADIGQAYADSLEENKLNTDKFSKQVAIILLDTLKKSIQTQIRLAETSNIAIATAGALAQPDSIASFGLTGLVRAGILTGLIEAAFAIVKSQIASESFGKGGIVPKAERGLMIGGKPHSQGGTKFYGSDGTRFEAEQGELLAIVNKRSTGLLKGLSDLNSFNNWGVDFFKSSPKPYLEDGGFAARSVSVPVQSQVEQQAAFSDAVRQFQGKFVVLVEDINSAQRNKVKVEQRAII